MAFPARLTDRQVKFLDDIAKAHGDDTAQLVAWVTGHSLKCDHGTLVLDPCQDCGVGMLSEGAKAAATDLRDEIRARRTA